MSLRVLYVLANEPTGGVGVFVRDFTAHFSDEVTIDYLIYTEKRNTPFQQAIAKPDAKIYYLPELMTKNYLNLRKETDAFFHAHQGEYPIVHLTYPGLVNLTGKPARKYGTSWVIIHSLNSRLSDDPLRSMRNKLLISNFRRTANCYLACSMEAAEYLYGKRMIQNHEVLFIHNAIDCKQYRFDPIIRNQVRSELGIGKRRLILMAGRLEKQKNIGFGIQVFSELLKQNPDCFLMIIGDGPLKESLQQEAKTLGLNDDQISFQSFTPKLNELFMAADLLLFPSLYEGLPITVVDAENSGLPCLLSDTISREVKLADCVEFCSLKESPAHWAKQARFLMTLPRKQRTEEVTAGGYNILEESRKLEQLYLDLGRKTR